MTLPLLLVLLAALSGLRLEQSWQAESASAEFRFEPGMVVTGSDSVWVDGLLVEHGGYSVDGASGKLLLAQAAAQGAVVKLVCRKVVFSGMRSEYRLHVPDTTRIDTGEVRYVAVEEEERGQAAGNVGLSGTKTLGVSLGGVDAGINQSTSLAVSGEVEGVRIAGELSDQSQGIPAEGTSTELAELDQIAIALDGRMWQARLGDQVLSADAGALGRVERKSLGARVEYRPGPLAAQLGYARPRGQFGRVALSGKDRVQGPYLLAPDGRSAQLVPGSEHVFLDSKSLTRGWDKDYTIDYSTAELVFTNRNIITNDSRIEADFQYLTEAYVRQDIIAGLGYESGQARVQTRFFQEGDDPNQLLGDELTPEERQYLSSIGSDTSKAWLDGARLTGDSAGDYVYDSSAAAYRYVGTGKGNYDVRFTFVGDSAGEYEYVDTLGAYEFRGLGKGGYVPRVRVALPVRQDIVMLGASYSGAGFDLSLSAAGLRSLANLFAAGGAPSASGAGLAEAGWTGSKLRAKYRARMQAQGFALPGADTAVDFAYRWGGITLSQVRSGHEFGATTGPVAGFTLGADAGLLLLHDGSNRTRYEGRLVSNWLGLEAGRVGPELRYAGNLNPVFGRFRPRVGAARRTDADADLTNARVGLGVTPLKSLDLDAAYSHVFRDSVDSVGVRGPVENGGTVETALDWKAGERVTIDGRLAWQYRRFASNPGDDWSQWLGTVSGDFAPVTGTTLRADLGQSSRLIQLRDELFRFVGLGKGQYARDTLTGRYYPDPEGSYERVLVARGRFVSATERTVNTSFAVGSWQPVELAGSASYSAAGDSQPVQELASFDARLAIREWEQAVVPRLGANGSRSLDRTLASTGRRTENARVFSEVSTSAWPAADVRLYIERATNRRVYSSGLLDYAEQGWAAEFEPVLKVQPKLDLTLRLGLSDIEQPLTYPELGRFRFRELDAGIARVFTLGERLRATVGLTLSHVSASVPELPFEVALTRPLGYTPGASLEATQMISDVVSAALSYRFENRPDRAAEHQLSAELRATF